MLQLIISSDDKGIHREQLVESAKFNELKARLVDGEKYKKELEQIKEQLAAKNVQDNLHKKIEENDQQVKALINSKWGLGTSLILLATTCAVGSFIRK